MCKEENICEFEEEPLYPYSVLYFIYVEEYCYCLFFVNEAFFNVVI